MHAAWYSTCAAAAGGGRTGAAAAPLANTPCRPSAIHLTAAAPPRLFVPAATHGRPPGRAGAACRAANAEDGKAGDAPAAAPAPGLPERRAAVRIRRPSPGTSAPPSGKPPPVGRLASRAAVRRRGSGHSQAPKKPAGGAASRGRTARGDTLSLRIRRQRSVEALQALIDARGGEFGNEHVVEALRHMRRLHTHGSLTALHAAEADACIRALLRLRPLYKMQAHPGLLAQLLYCLAYFGVRRRPLINALLTYASRRLRSTSAHNLALLIVGVASLGVKPSPSWMERYCEALGARASELQPRDCAAALAALAALRYAPSRHVVEMLAARAQVAFGSMTPGDVAVAAASLAALRLRPSRAFLTQLVQQSVGKLTGCTALGLCRLLSALQAFNFTPPAWWAREFLRVSWLRFRGASTQHLAALLQGAAKVKLEPDARWLQDCLWLFRASPQTVTVGQVVAVACGLALLEGNRGARVHVRWVRLALLRLRGRFGLLSGQQLTELLYAAVQLEALPPPPPLPRAAAGRGGGSSGSSGAGSAVRTLAAHNAAVRMALQRAAASMARMQQQSSAAAAGGQALSSASNASSITPPDSAYVAAASSAADAAPITPGEVTALSSRAAQDRSSSSRAALPTAAVDTAAEPALDDGSQLAAADEAEAWLLEWLDATQAALPSFSPTQLAVVATALGELRRPLDPTWLDAFLAQALRRVGEFAPDEMASVVVSCAELALPAAPGGPLAAYLSAVAARLGGAELLELARAVRVLEAYAQPRYPAWYPPLLKRAKAEFATRR